MQTKTVVSLCDVGSNCEAIIIAVPAPFKVAKRLVDLGLTPTTTVKILRKTMGDGPIEIQIRGAKLILSRKIATTVLVEPQ